VPDQRGIVRVLVQPSLPDFDIIPPMLNGLSEREMLQSRIVQLEQKIDQIMSYLALQQQTADYGYDVLGKRINEFDVTAGIRDFVTVTTTAHTADDDGVILVDDDTAAATVTVTLPAAEFARGFIYHIKKLGTTANVVVDGNGSETIDDATTATLTAQYESIMIVCDGSNWHII